MIPLLVLGLALAAPGATPAASPATPAPTAASPAPTAAASPTVDPGLESLDAGQQYAAWAARHRLKGDAASLACMPFVATAQLCFSHVVDDRRVYLTLADGRTPVELLKQAAGDEAAAVAPLAPAYVDGFSPRYFAVSGDPRAHAAMLFPEALEARLGGKCVVGVPARGVLMAWVPGDLDFDKVMAVGVRRLYDSLPNPVTPTLYTFDGKAWQVWGEAVDTPPG